MTAAVQMRDLVVELGGVRILDQVGATFAGSALTAVAGPNGSGKTTLLRTLVGITPPAAGSVTLTGPGGTRDLPGMPPRERALLLAMVGQDAPVTALRVRDVVALGRLPHRRWFEEVEVGPFLERAGVAHLADRDVATLSGGERQRVHVARALAQEPAWLVLDEPTNHLDLAAQREVLGLARDLTRDGVSVVAALHDLNHVLAFADHVVVLRAGRVHAEGVPDDVLRPDLVREVWGAAVESVATSRGRRLV